MQVEIERSHWSIVLVGSFNPPIFNPSWLELHGVVSKDVAAMAETEIVHNQISSMTLGDIELQVEVNKFQVSTTIAPEIRLLDLVSKVFGDILPHSKITDFGVNKSAHFRMSSAEKRTELGRALAPLGIWGSFGDRIAASEGCLVGGLMSLRLREIITDEESKGHLEARVGPSNALNPRMGVMVEVNRHFELKELSEKDGARRAMEKLDKEFVDSITECDKIITHIAEIVS